MENDSLHATFTEQIYGSIVYRFRYLRQKHGHLCTLSPKDQPLGGRSSRRYVLLRFIRSEWTSVSFADRPLARCSSSSSSRSDWLMTTESTFETEALRTRLCALAAGANDCTDEPKNRTNQGKRSLCSSHPYATFFHRLGERPVRVTVFGRFEVLRPLSTILVCAVNYLQMRATGAPRVLETHRVCSAGLSLPAHTRSARKQIGLSNPSRNRLCFPQPQKCNQQECHFQNYSHKQNER